VNNHRTLEFKRQVSASREHNYQLWDLRDNCPPHVNNHETLGSMGQLFASFEQSNKALDSKGRLSASYEHSKGTSGFTEG
jgi:hypothetical protein